MIKVSSPLFDQAYEIFGEVLNQRLNKHSVHIANVVNAETPGYRARGYEFEKQLQEMIGHDKKLQLKPTNGNHYLNDRQLVNGKLVPDIFIQPTESIGNDGNTVNVEGEMGALAENQIMYRTTSEVISKKLALLRYAITGGR